jgi:hypothetical protein
MSAPQCKAQGYPVSLADDIVGGSDQIGTRLAKGSDILLDRHCSLADPGNQIVWFGDCKFARLPNLHDESDDGSLVHRDRH